MGLIVTHLSGLLRFSGRESQRSFWLWFACVMGLLAVLGLVVVASVVLGLTAELQRIAVEHPGRVTIVSGPTSYHAEMTGPASPAILAYMAEMMWRSVAVAAVGVLLLGAAAVRRLHDVRRRGWWLLLPTPFAATALALFPRVIANLDPADMSQFFVLVFNNMAYLATIAIVLVMLAIPGKPDANRYGPSQQSKQQNYKIRR